MTNYIIEFPGLGLTLNPPAGFTIGSFEVRFYGLIIALGLILAVAFRLALPVTAFSITKSPSLSWVAVMPPWKKRFTSRTSPPLFTSFTAATNSKPSPSWSSA